MLPSVRPRTMWAISASLRLSPSRFRRMISCGKKACLPASAVMAQPLAEADQQAAEVVGGAPGLGQGLGVAERLVAEPGGEVGDGRDRRHAEPAMAGDDHPPP